ncbi:MAG: hypothetical protein WCS56_00130 [Bacilli bacterium]
MDITGQVYNETMTQVYKCFQFRVSRLCWAYIEDKIGGDVKEQILVQIRDRVAKFDIGIRGAVWKQIRDGVIEVIVN